MTTALQLPAATFEAPFANPIAGGLYSAATVNVVDDPPRLAGGVQVWPSNVGDVQTYDPSCGASNPDKAQTGPGTPATFAPIGVVASDECFLGRDEAESRRRAEQILRIKEQVAVEANWVTRLLADAGTVAAATGTAGSISAFLDGVGRLELFLGQRGIPGVIHASAQLAALAVHLQVAKPATAGRLLSPLGHVWAFGGGYGALGNRLVATGPVFVQQSAIDTYVGSAVRKNARLAIAEREVVVAYEGAAAAVTI